VATTTPDLPAGETVAGDLAGMGSFLIDPQGAGKCLHNKWFWLWPVIVVSIISISARILLLPAMQHVLEIRPIPGNVTPEQFQRQTEIAMAIQHFANYVMPVIVACLMAIQALILWASSSVLGIQAKFRSLFNLAAGCSIISALGALAMAVVVRAKGDVSTLAALQPPLGLDIFLGDGANKFLVAFVGFFSVFEIWWIVMAVLILSAGLRVSKGKAVAVVAPLVLLGLALKVISAAFQR
jgi:hypothetical protein